MDQTQIYGAESRLLATDEVSADQINRQMELILSSKHFRQAKSLEKFLRDVVTKKLAGAEDELKEYTVGVDVFQRADELKSYGGRDRDVYAVITVWPGKLHQRRILILSGSTPGRRWRRRNTSPIPNICVSSTHTWINAAKSRGMRSTPLSSRCSCAPRSKIISPSTSATSRTTILRLQIQRRPNQGRSKSSPDYPLRKDK